MNLTHYQLQKMRFLLFAKAAESMGQRVQQLKEHQTEENQKKIAAIKAEWLVDDDT